MTKLEPKFLKPENALLYQTLERKARALDGYTVEFQKNIKADGLLSALQWAESCAVEVEMGRLAEKTLADFERSREGKGEQDSFSTDERLERAKRTVAKELLSNLVGDYFGPASASLFSQAVRDAKRKAASGFLTRFLGINLEEVLTTRNV